MFACGVVAYFIPGCHIDEGVGASVACGASGPLLATGILGGFVWLTIGILGLIPTLILHRWKNRHASENLLTNYSLNALKADEEKKTDSE